MKTNSKKKLTQKSLGPKWRSRVVGRSEVDPRKLKDHPLNWRLHPETQQRVMRDGLETIGVIDDIIVNKRTGHVIDGHGRKALAIENEEETVGVLYVDLTVDEENLALAMFNPLGELAATDPEKLAALLGEVERHGGPLDGLLAELEEQASGAVVKETETRAPGSRSVGGQSHVMRMMLENPDVATVERALAMTGNANRGQALLAICAAYLGNVTNAERQHDANPKSSLEDQLAEAFAGGAGDPGDARRPRPRVRKSVPDRAPGGGVRSGPDEGGAPGAPAADVVGVPG